MGYKKCSTKKLISLYLGELESKISKDTFGTSYNPCQISSAKLSKIIGIYHIYPIRLWHNGSYQIWNYLWWILSILLYSLLTAYINIAPSPNPPQNQHLTISSLTPYLMQPISVLSWKEEVPWMELIVISKVHANIRKQAGLLFACFVWYYFNQTSEIELMIKVMTFNCY